MLQHRLAEQFAETADFTQLPLRNPVGGFVVMPLACAVAVDPMQQWLYQQAFAAAQQEVQAERRADWLTASLN